MRVVFTADVDIDIKTVDKKAYGALGMKRSVVDGLPGPMGYFFRKGWEADISPEMANKLIADGSAELVAGRTVIIKELGEE